ncbi:histone H1-like repetitive region-containing protein [Luteimonas changyuni]|uniref:histone H1-like repetitive region-containing protein n=1 Tax=Luteimonas sp. MJ145 TaxID=3129234 RepID=UPI0031BA4F66
MAFTRAQATELLNKAEMRLYDDSRANALRGFDRAALAGRATRARASRDRARDMLKRQRVAARKRGDSKATGAGGVAARTARKEELLAEILGRFIEARRTAPEVVAKKATAKKATAKKATAKKAAVKKAAVKKAAVKKAAVKKATAKKAPAKKAPAKKAPAKKATAKKATVKKVSPERALANTRKLLEAKNQRDRSPQPWQSLDPVADHVPQPGYQSPQAASKAHDLHAGESRMASIHGSMSTTDRHNQGKRDGRGDTD